MDISRINVKFYLDDGDGQFPPQESWHRALSAWIPETPDEVLIDVADYSHVQHGPLTVLVGHDANYAVDNTDGRLGLIYRRKQPLEGDFPQRLRETFRLALIACGRLEADAKLAGIRFRGDEALIVLNDRLSAPNTLEAWQTWKPAVDGQLEALFGGPGFQTRHTPDDRQALTITAIFQKDLGIDGLLKNLDV